MPITAGRPGVLMADRFTDALLHTVTDHSLRALPFIGSIDQLIDNTDALASPQQYRRAADFSPNLTDPMFH